MGDAEERADEVGLSSVFEEVAAGARPWAGSCFCLQHLFPATPPCTATVPSALTRGQVEALQGIFGDDFILGDPAEHGSQPPPLALWSFGKRAKLCSWEGWWLSQQRAALLIVNL